MKIPLLKLLLFLFMPLVFLAQNTERNLSSEHWQFRKFGDSDWMEAKVPGTVHTDLFQNKIIPNPFFGANENQLQWIENENWQYETTFKVSKAELENENCFLQFDGLDTYAEVFLNGSPILSANNMFRKWEVDIKRFLKAGENNILHVNFLPAAKRGKEKAKTLAYELPGDEKIFTRKAQYQYGWDWGPRFVTAGIWKKVSLHFWNKATILNVKCNQKIIAKDKATLEFITQIQSYIAGEFKLNINEKTTTVELKRGLNKIITNYSIEQPKLWWPNGLGNAYLYPFEINLLHNEVSLSKKEMKIGLRTIELVEDKDKIGTSFYFKINGIPVFMKGANYIPPDSFLPRATDSVYKSIVKNAVDANMNMLRVWGGGVYADDAFYDACDENGILVWQDFMFACAMYPGDNDFLSNVRNEVIDNVARLQNHPCIALWCGNNESDEGWHNWGWQKQYKYSEQDSTKIWNDYKKLFHELIPQTLDSLLPKNENRYWPSSPSIGWGRKESLLSGDSHYWGVWWGMEPFEVYENKVGRFMSEYGFQGMPNLETFKSFANEVDLNLNSEAVKNHQKHKTGYQTINEYMARDYKVPTKFEDYVYVSQLLQAEGMKTAIEAHRRAKPNCMGTLFWQLNDCWPVTSWSSLDYFGRWKAVQYQVKKSFENVLISIKEEKENYAVYVVNDDKESYAGYLDLRLLDFSGNLLWRHEVQAVILSNSSLIQFKIPKKDFKEFDLTKSVLNVSYYLEDQLMADALHYFVKPKDLQLTKPNIQIKKTDAKTIEVSSDVLAKNVFLSSAQDAFFSDNYLDILPNQKVKITLSKPVEKIEVKSLFDTMN